MKTIRISVLILALAAIALLGQPANLPQQLPLWTGGIWKYFSLSPAFKITGSVIDVAAVQTPFVPAADDLFVLTQAQATFQLRCTRAEVFRNGILQTNGQDYSLDATGKLVTFTPNVPQATDVVQILYRCQ